MSAYGFHQMLQRLLPVAFRERYGEQMAHMFEDEWRDSSVLQRIVLTARALLDVVWSAAALRIGVAAPRPQGRAEPGRVRLAGFGLDVRAAWRSLVQRPGYSVTAIATLALGIGAATAVFSVVLATVLRALPAPEPDRLVAVWSAFRNAPDAEFMLSAAEFEDIRRDARTIERAGAWSQGSTTLDARDGRPARTVSLAFTIGDVYDLLGARTQLGRLPGADDDRIGAPLVAVLTHDFWQQAFAGDRRIVDAASLRLGSVDVRVIGVLAPGIALPQGTHDVWVHRVQDPASWALDRSGHGLNAVVRLRTDAAIDDFAAELGALQASWRERYAGQHTVDGEAHSLRVAPLTERMLGNARRVALLLSGASLLLLLLAAANVANLLLARGETRTAEVGVRLAMGSSRARVARPVILEGVVLGVCGGALGLGLAAFGLPALLRLAPASLASDVGIDRSVVSFALLVSLLTGVVFSLLPAWAAARRDPAALLRASARGRTAVSRTLRVLVLSQTALATVLLCGALLLTRSLQELNATAPGFDTRDRVALDVTLPVTAYPEATEILAFWETARSQIAQLPHVESVALVRNLPLRDAQRTENTAPHDALGHDAVISIDVQAASAAVLETMGVALRAGRDLAHADRAGAARAVIINESAARALWPTGPAVGRQLRVTFSGLGTDPWTVVGVYADVRSNDLTQPARPELMLPLGQLEPTRGWTRSMTLVVRTTAPPDAALTSLRAVLYELDANVPVEGPVEMREVVRAAASRERFLSVLLGVFAALATLISAVGVFGVVSFAVARQQREFAIRSALGAGRLGIFAAVLRGNVLMAVTGAVCGGLLAWLAAPAIGAFLYNVAPRDLRVMVALPMCVALVAVLSAVPAALHATRVEPAAAMNESD